MSLPPPDAAELAGSKNVRLSVEGTIIHIYCDLSKDFGASSTGKTTVIASSSGNKALGNTNAFIGLNVFCKDLEKRKVPLTEPLGPLEWDHCTACVTGNILDIAVDLSNVGAKEAASGKSVLLAMSAGNKILGATGIMCGFNCYRPVDKELLLANAGGIAALANLQPGSVETLNGAFAVSVPTPTTAEIAYTLSMRDTEEGQALPPISICGASVSFTARPIKKKGAAPSSSAAVESHGANRADATHVADGVFRPLGARSRGVSCSVQGGILRVQFDPSQDLGLSGSGKSVLVATSGGAVAVDGADVQITLNVIRPAPPVTLEAVEPLVRQFLDAQPAETLANVSLRAVLVHVQEGLKLQELQDKHKQLIVEAVKGHHARISESQSSCSQLSQPSKRCRGEEGDEENSTSGEGTTSLVQRPKKTRNSSS